MQIKSVSLTRQSNLMLHFASTWNCPKKCSGILVLCFLFSCRIIVFLNLDNGDVEMPKHRRFTFIFASWWITLVVFYSYTVVGNRSTLEKLLVSRVALASSIKIFGSIGCTLNKISMNTRCSVPIYSVYHYSQLWLEQQASLDPPSLYPTNMYVTGYPQLSLLAIITRHAFLKSNLISRWRLVISS